MTAAFLTLIVPAAQQQLAQKIAATLDPSGGQGMWTTGLSTTGAPPATHYISTGYVGDGWLNLVPVAEWAQDASGQWVEVSRTPGDAPAVVAGCKAAGITVTLKEVNALFAAADVTQQAPFVAMARLWLQIVQELTPTPLGNPEE